MKTIYAWVLVHFFFSFNARQFTVRLGDVDLRRDDEPSSPETYYVTDVRGHHKFARVGFYNDIAILVLDRPVKRSKYIIPLCLPPRSAKSETFVGQTATVVGWGTTYYGNCFNYLHDSSIYVWKSTDMIYSCRTTPKPFQFPCLLRWTINLCLR